MRRRQLTCTRRQDQDVFYRRQFARRHDALIPHTASVKGVRLTWPPPPSLVPAASPTENQREPDTLSPRTPKLSVQQAAQRVDRVDGTQRSVLLLTALSQSNVRQRKSLAVMSQVSGARAPPEGLGSRV
eukprot:2827581-Rhodomonas_salina.1